MRRKITDKDRINFLRDVAWSVDYNTSQNIDGKWKCFVGSNCDGYGETPRQAIDSAMQAYEEKP